MDENKRRVVVEFSETINKRNQNEFLSLLILLVFYSYIYKSSDLSLPVLLLSVVGIIIVVFGSIGLSSGILLEGNEFNLHWKKEYSRQAILLKLAFLWYCFPIGLSLYLQPIPGSPYLHIFGGLFFIFIGVVNFLEGSKIQKNAEELFFNNNQ